MTVPVIAVLNMKGGVGKTTISAHLMRVLYMIKRKSTLLVDFDPQFNLTQAIIKQSDYAALKENNKTILTVMESTPIESLFSVTQRDENPPSVDDVSVVLRKLSNTNISLSLVPGDFRLVKYSLIDDNKALLPVKARFKKFIEESKRKYEIICLDCNPSSSFMTLCALEVATHLLIPIRPDKFSILGLEMLDSFVSNLESIRVKPKQIIVMNGVSRKNYNSEVESILRTHEKFSRQTLTSRLVESTFLAANNSYTGFAYDKGGPHSERLRHNLIVLAQELGSELGFTA